MLLSEIIRNILIAQCVWAEVLMGIKFNLRRCFFLMLAFKKADTYCLSSSRYLYWQQTKSIQLYSCCTIKKLEELRGHSIYNWIWMVHFKYDLSYTARQKLIHKKKIIYLLYKTPWPIIPGLTLAFPCTNVIQAVWPYGKILFSILEFLGKTMISNSGKIFVNEGSKFC